MYKFTKKFRTKTLKMSLREMASLTGVNFTTISAFENGKSTNYLILLDYYKVCKTQEQREIFLRELTQEIRQYFS